MHKASKSAKDSSGWVKKPLAEVTQVLRRGKAPSYVTSSPVRVIGQKCVQRDGFQVYAARPQDPAQVNKSLIAAPGDVLLNSTGSGTIGRSCVFDAVGKFVVDSHVTLIRASRDIVEPRWLDLVLRSPRMQARLESHCFVGSTNQLELSRAELARTEVPIPPLGEQRRIIDMMVAELESERAIEASLVKLRSVWQGALEEAFLSAGSAGVGETVRWPEKRLSEVAHVGGGIALGGIAAGIGAVDVPYLRVANVQDGYISTRDMKTVRATPAEVERFQLRRGDVLLTEGGDLDKLGRGGIWDGRIAPCLHQNHVFRVRCVESKMLPEFLALYLSTSRGREYFMRVAKQTTNLASVSSSQVKNMPVPSPSLSEQRHIIDLIEEFRHHVVQEELELQKMHSLRRGLEELFIDSAV